MGKPRSNAYTYILVYSTAHAIKIEKLLAEQGIACRLVPTPRQLSSDCGVCARLARADAQAARRLIEEAKVDIEGICDG
ncbi:MAG: DUF3343 domain-containing protein [Anaerolineales bacterium]|nr:DUF3343 domain-containing protein [Anaerolineales bacterium]